MKRTTDVGAEPLNPAREHTAFVIMPKSGPIEDLFQIAKSTTFGANWKYFQLSKIQLLSLL